MTETMDGRTRRALRTRDQIVDATIALVDEGDLRPTALRVAERAGVSVRSVFQHFADIEGLYAAVGDRVADRLQALVLLVDPEQPLADRLAEVVRQRSTLLEAVTPILRATLVHAWDSETVDTRVRFGGRFLRDEVARAFAPELAAAPDDRRQVLLDALDASLSWPVWEHLRAVARRDIDSARGVVALLVEGALAAAGATGAR